MEKFIRSYDKEYMRMAILKHEETFKEQVYELHRLYQIQKMLMRGIQSNSQNVQNQDICNSNNKFSSSQIGYEHKTQQRSHPTLDLERPAEEYIVESTQERVIEIEDEREIELTLGIASYYARKKPLTPPNLDSGPSLSSSYTGFGTKKGKSSARKEELCGHNWGLIKVPHDSSLALTHGRNKIFDVDEQLGQDRHERPHWLFQALSLNMT